MPDLLAHALLAWAIGTTLSWRYGWLRPAHVTVCIVGAFVPDMVKIRLIVDPDLVPRLLGLGGTPFSWNGLHTGGPVLVSILIGVLVVAAGERRQVFSLLSIGAASHLLTDGLIMNPSGQSYAMFWPLTRWHPPTPGLYQSAQVEPTLAALLVAAGVWVVNRRRGPEPEDAKQRQQ